MRTKLIKKLTGQTRGDTIVEVLIALSIISLILVLAYATAGRSTQSLQDSQEHREATALAQSQLEYVRSNNGLETGSKGCFDETGTPAERNATNCRFKAGGTASNCSDGTACFMVDITRDSTYVYTVNVTWDGLGDRNGNVSFWYRLSPIAAASPSGPSGPSGPGGAGEAVIDPGGGGIPGTPPVGGQYHYERAFLNASNNDPAHITGCTWNWGGGATTSYGASSTYCRYGIWTPNHTFLPSTPLPPYPAACYGVPGANAYRFSYSVTLTIDFDNAASKTSAPSTGYLPDCF